MWVRVLGAAAGGGFPEWNCNCPNCRAVREGSAPCLPRTQSSLAVSGDYQHWFLFNASPDIRSQIEAFPPLRPQRAPRHTPIQGVVLSDAEADHTLGLLCLREAPLLHIYATKWIHTAISEWNPILRTLRAYCKVVWQQLPLQEPVALCRTDGLDSGLRCQAFSTGSDKTAAFAPGSDSHPEAVVGFRITDARTGRALVYAPGVQELNVAVRDQLRDCAGLFIDGTCWVNDELPRLGISLKTARAMGHVPISGPGASLEYLATVDVGRRVYIHINNTNPILIENSPQRQAVEARGIEVAVDGMEMEI
jgi:pyrroloquinoline quinone biosynthesis protein B